MPQIPKNHQTEELDIPKKIREIIYDRDGCQCRICGSTEILSIHHILPRSNIRIHDYCNLVLVCQICHDAIESHKLPSWSAVSAEKLFHLTPVKAFCHFYEYEKICCAIHNMPLFDNIKEKPVSHNFYNKIAFVP